MAKRSASPLRSAAQRSASSRPARRAGKSALPTKKTKITRAKLIDGKTYIVQPDGSLVPAQDKTDWKRVRAMTDEEIEAAVASDPDAAPIADDEWFRKAVALRRDRKERVGIRLDHDVLFWFRSKGRGYQTHINDVLRRYMEAQRSQAGANQSSA